MDWQAKKRQTFVEMEDKLLEDSTGSYRKELINKLLEFESELNIMIHDAEADQDIFERLNILKKAIRSAKETLEKF